MGVIQKVRSTMRRWLGLLFGRTKEIRDITKTQINEAHYQEIERWKAIYAGHYENHHTMEIQTVNGKRKRRRHSLGMAKVVSEELSKMVFNEKVDIHLNDDVLNDHVDTLFTKNRFYKVFQGKLENMFALGGLVLKAHPKEQPDGSYKLDIQYVMPDCFVPTTYDSDEITEGTFLTITRSGDKVYCLFEFHTWKYEQSDDSEEIVKKLSIRNELFEKSKNDATAKETMKQVPLETQYPGLKEEVLIEGLTQPLFQYIKPNKANNKDLQSPLGVSIFSNALDTLYAIDVAFDSFIREFRLGKRRIIVPAAALKSVVDPQSGTVRQYFDADDETYEAFQFQDPEKQKIMDNTVELRVDEHVGAINALLNLLSMQIGFSSGTFTFDGQSVKTATEIVSEKSKTYQTKQSNEDLIEEGLGKFIITVLEVAQLYDIIEDDIDYSKLETSFYWDDSIIKDKHTESDFLIKLKSNGLVSSKYVLMNLLELTEEQAEEMIKEVADEQASKAPSMEDLIGGNDFEDDE